MEREGEDVASELQRVQTLSEIVKKKIVIFVGGFILIFILWDKIYLFFFIFDKYNHFLKIIVTFLIFKINVKIFYKINFYLKITIFPFH